MSCGVGCRLSYDHELLWLWRRQVATATIRPLAWEPPYAAGSCPRKGKKTKKTKQKKKEDTNELIYKTEIDSPTANKVMVTQGQKGRGRVK